MDSDKPDNSCVSNKQQCPICSEVIEKRQRITHLNKHFGIVQNNFSCNYCSKTFANQKMCQAHEQTHAKEPAFSNETGGNSIGPKPFSVNNKIYACKHCPKIFKFASRLTRHLVAHSLDRPYKCLYCPKTFKYVQYVWEHLTNHRRNSLNASVMLRRKIDNTSNSCKNLVKESKHQKTLSKFIIYNRRTRKQQPLATVSLKIPIFLENVDLNPKVVLSQALNDILSKHLGPKIS